MDKIKKIWHKIAHRWISAEIEYYEHKIGKKIISLNKHFLKFNQFPFRPKRRAGYDK